MYASSRPAVVAGALLLGSSLGCTQSLRISPTDFSGGAEIPTGQWRGWGTYTECMTVRTNEDEAPSQQQSKRGVYETTLTITDETLFGYDARVFDIRSKRGKLLNLDDETTHLRVALVRLPELADGKTLYAVAEWQYNPKPTDTWNESAFRTRARFASASCIRAGPATVLQLHYIIPDEHDAPSFLDTFHFSKRHVVKTGSVTSTENIEQDDDSTKRTVAQVHWVERLTRVE